MNIRTGFLLALACLVLGAAPEDAGPSDAFRVIAQERSQFGEVFVTEEKGLRTLRMGSEDGEEQTVLDMAEPGRMVLEYTKDMAAAMPRAPEGPALFLGLGGGALVHAWRAQRTEEAVAVDIDPLVVRFAREHFLLDDAKPVRTVTSDALVTLRAWLRPVPPREQFAFVAVDVYGTGDGPRYLSSRAFFEAIHKVTVPDAVITVNLAVGKFKAWRIEQRFSEVFGACEAVVGRADANVVLIGTRTTATPTAKKDDTSSRCVRTTMRKPDPVKPKKKSKRARKSKRRKKSKAKRTR